MFLIPDTLKDGSEETLLDPNATAVGIILFPDRDRCNTGPIESSTDAYRY